MGQIHALALSRLIYDRIAVMKLEAIAFIGRYCDFYCDQVIGPSSYRQVYRPSGQIMTFIAGMLQHISVYMHLVYSSLKQ